MLSLETFLLPVHTRGCTPLWCIKLVLNIPHLLIVMQCTTCIDTVQLSRSRHPTAGFSRLPFQRRVKEYQQDVDNDGNVNLSRKQWLHASLAHDGESVLYQYSNFRVVIIAVFYDNRTNKLIDPHILIHFLRIA